MRMLVASRQSVPTAHISYKSRTLAWLSFISDGESATACIGHWTQDCVADRRSTHPRSINWIIMYIHAAPSITRRVAGGIWRRNVTDDTYRAFRQRRRHNDCQANCQRRICVVSLTHSRTSANVSTYGVLVLEYVDLCDVIYLLYLFRLLKFKLKFKVSRRQKPN